jgi:hypothetical protein
MAVIDTSNIINLDDVSNLFGGDDGSRVANTTTNTSGAVSNTPVSRTLSFTITSTPSGASILLNGVNTNFITPHVMRFEETELLTPKVISVVNGTNNSLETFVISTEVVTKTTGTSNGDDSKGDGSQFGPTSTGGGSSGPTLPTDTQEDFDRQTFRPEVDPNGNPGRGNAQK